MRRVGELRWLDYIIFLIVKKATFICVDGFAKLRFPVGELLKSGVLTRGSGVPLLAEHR